MITLAIGIFLIGFLVAFSSSLKAMYKKISGIWGMRLLLPLIIITLMVILNEPLFAQSLLMLRISYLQFTLWLMDYIPLETGAFFIASTVIILLITFIPLVFFYYYNKKKSYAPFQQAGLVTFFCWLSAVLLSLMS